MNQKDITDFLIALGSVRTVLASEENGDPELAWGDTFYYVTNSAGQSPKMPFATVVIKDYTGFDEASKLNRGGLFRLNVDLGKERFEELFGYLPAEHQAQHDRYDYTALNVVFPHPTYANYGWASIINPSGNSEVQVKEILVAAHERALRKIGK
jgi:hypothetical protein